MIAVLTLVAAMALPADLTVTPTFEATKWVSPRDPVEFRLSHPLGTKVAVFAGARDVTALFEAEGSVIRYRTGVPPLPSGEQELVLYAVSAEGEWKEIGRYPIKVLTRRGFEKASVKPSLDLTNKGQLQMEQVPADHFSSRDRFQDVTAQAGLSSELQRGNFVLRTQANLTGVSYRNEALRFGVKGEKAPLLDLAGYRVDLEKGLLRLAVGHVGFGNHRHLASGFNSRGAVLTLGAGRPVDFSLGIANGTAIVGWDNVVGLDERRHRVSSATVGVELIPSRPGGARLEASLLEGSLLPLDGFRDAGVRSAERSRGGAVRLVLAHPSQRFTFDGGWSRSRFRPQGDAQLEEGLSVTAIPETERDAAYADATFVLVQNQKVLSQPINLSTSATFERVEPLYRSIPSYVQADIVRTGISLNGSWGPLTLQASTQNMEDNLDDVRSILKTKTAIETINGALSLGALLGAHKGARWLPMLTMSAGRTHQYGAWLPINSGFAESHVPDQLSLNYQAALEWQLSPFRFGFRGSMSDQDNRQAGRALSDFIVRAGSAYAGFTPSDRLDIAYELGLEESQNMELVTRDRNRRHGVTVGWRLFADVNAAANYSQTYGRDGARTNERRAYDSFVELSSGFRLWRSPRQQNRSRIFVRYSDRQSSTFDRLFGVNVDNSGWSMTSGVNLSVY
jgi:hypothetical protein